VPQGKHFQLQGCSAAEQIEQDLKNYAQRQHSMKKTK
jgi:hypothetical protein